MYSSLTKHALPHSRSHSHRLGHSTNIALLASSQEQERDEYIQGIQMFCFFNLFVMILWTAILIILKIMGPSRVGCAAGGDVLNVPHLRKQYDRATRKAIEKRSWRVQTTFLITSILLFLVVGLFLNKGLAAMSTSLQEVYDIHESIERVTTRAQDIVTSLQLEQRRMHTAQVHALLNMDSYCPNIVGDNTETLSASELQALNITQMGETMRASLQEIDAFMDTRVYDANKGLSKVQEATDAVDQGIHWFQDNEWKPRLCAVVIVVLDVFLLIGLVLSRNNIAFNPYWCMMKCVLIPAFCVCLFLTALATYGFGAGAVMNADFCAGGDYPGSPKGTIEEIMNEQGVGPRDIMYQSFQYYVNVSDESASVVVVVVVTLKI